MSHPQAGSRIFEPQSVLLLDDDVMVTEGLAAGLEREGRTLVTCNDLETAEIIVERFRPTHVVADVRLSGQFGCEGLNFLPYIRNFAPETRVILMSGDGSDALQLEASERGAVAFFHKPFDLDALDATLDMMHSTAIAPAYQGSRTIRVPDLDSILADPGLRPHFQPIVSLADPTASLGFESLARFTSDSPLRSPEVLFQYASKKRRTIDLETRCLASTALLCEVLPETSLVFINIHPEAFASGPRLLDAFDVARKAGLTPERIVIEITEQAALASTPAVLSTIDELRRRGMQFAFDDVGMAYSHLPMIERVRPSYLKISQEFGVGFEKNATRTKIVRSIVALARDFGCEVILEGIEDQSTADAAHAIGIEYGQGFFFARPAEASTFRSEYTLEMRGIA
jgi:EAL domain-containing protein (putative c-di-GMP-specific phosphodiesterase class I)/ActR/RegA family two-component response regulator